MNAEHHHELPEIRKKFPNLHKLIDMNATKPLPWLQVSMTLKTAKARHRITSVNGSFAFFCSVADIEAGISRAMIQLIIHPGGLEDVRPDLVAVDEEDTRMIEFLCGLLILAAKQDAL